MNPIIWESHQGNRSQVFQPLVSDLSCGALMLRARMGIRAHPTLTNGKTWKGHIGTQSRDCAGQSVRPSPHSISQTSVGKLLNRSIFDTF